MNDSAQRDESDKTNPESELLDAQENLDAKSEDEYHTLPSQVEEISPNKRYVRFAEVIRFTDDIKVSYRGFDTRNGIEVAWHAIDLGGLKEEEQEAVARSASSLRELDNEYIAQYLSVWMDDEPRRLIIITTLLESLKEFIGKVRILRWRIVKKWCKQLLNGLSYLHSHNPSIVHRNISCEHVFINGGEGELKIGNIWLAAILDDKSDPVSFSETMMRHSRIIGSPACMYCPYNFEYSMSNCTRTVITFHR